MKTHSKKRMSPTDPHFFIAMEKLGPNLGFVMVNCFPRGFSLKTVAQIGAQMLDRVEAFHSLGLVHLDIKPDNLCLQLDIEECDS